MGSPASKGILQFDMWDVTPSDRYDWDGLKRRIQEHGLRNSQLMANMPTASTAQILGNTESFEVPNLKSLHTPCPRRRVHGPEPLPPEDLQALDLWNEDMVQHIIANRGSVQHAPNIPQQLKDVYKTVWEIKQKACMEQAVDRAHTFATVNPLICTPVGPSDEQTQFNVLLCMEVRAQDGWLLPPHQTQSKPIQFTVNAPKAVVNAVEDDGDVCMTCFLKIFKTILLLHPVESLSNLPSAVRPLVITLSNVLSFLQIVEIFFHPLYPLPTSIVRALCAFGRCGEHDPRPDHHTGHPVHLCKDHMSTSGQRDACGGGTNREKGHLHLVGLKLIDVLNSLLGWGGTINAHEGTLQSRLTASIITL